MSLSNRSFREVHSSFHRNLSSASKSSEVAASGVDLNLRNHSIAHLRSLGKFCTTRLPEVSVSQATRIVLDFEAAANAFFSSSSRMDVDEMKIAATELQFVLKGALKVADGKFHSFRHPDVNEDFRSSLLTVIYAGSGLVPIRKDIANFSTLSIEDQTELKSDLKAFVDSFVPKLKVINFERFSTETPLRKAV